MMHINETRNSHNKYARKGSILSYMQSQILQAVLGPESTDTEWTFSSFQVLQLVEVYFSVNTY